MCDTCDESRRIDAGLNEPGHPKARESHGRHVLSSCDYFGSVNVRMSISRRPSPSVTLAK